MWAIRHPDMPGQRKEAGRTVGVTRSHRPRPWLFPPRPWTKPGAHGRIADGGGPEWSLEQRMCWLCAGQGGPMRLVVANTRPSWVSVSPGPGSLARPLSSPSSAPLPVERGLRRLGVPLGPEL